MGIHFHWHPFLPSEHFFSFNVTTLLVFLQPFWLLLSPVLFSPLPSLLNVSMPEIPGPLLTLHTPLVDLTCYQESGSPSLPPAPEPDLTLHAQDKTLFPSKLSLFLSSPAPDSPPCPTATPEPESSKGQTPNPIC